MKFKVLVVIAVAGGMYYFGIKPADVLDKGGEMWAQFSGDLEALTSGEAVGELSAKVNTATKSSAGTDSSDPAGFIAERKAAAEAQAKSVNGIVDQHMQELEEKINQQIQ
jgi:hypothetical protein